MATSVRMVVNAIENAFERQGNGFEIKMRCDGTRYECWAREDGFYELREVSGAESLKFRSAYLMAQYILKRWR